MRSAPRAWVPASIVFEVLELAAYLNVGCCVLEEETPTHQQMGDKITMHALTNAWLAPAQDMY